MSMRALVPRVATGMAGLAVWMGAVTATPARAQDWRTYATVQHPSQYQSTGARSTRRRRR